MAPGDTLTLKYPLTCECVIPPTLIRAICPDLINWSEATVPKQCPFIAPTADVTFVIKMQQMFALLYKLKCKCSLVTGLCTVCVCAYTT